MRTVVIEADLTLILHVTDELENLSMDKLFAEANMMLSNRVHILRSMDDFEEPVLVLDDV